MTGFALHPEALHELFLTLRNHGYTVIGPRVRDGAVALDILTAVDELPLGWRDRQAQGAYAVHKSGDSGYFQYTCGPHSWKRFLYPARTRIFRASFEGGIPRVLPDQTTIASYAFLGMRACDLKAMEILDRVMLDPTFPDPTYREIRRRLLIIAVNCLEPGGTCFCAAMGAGPQVASPHDILLSEIVEPERCRLIAEPGSRAGAEMLSILRSSAAAERDLAQVRRMGAEAGEKMKNHVDFHAVPALFTTLYDHPHWQTLDARCLACGNCTLVCPTCFCHAVTEIECLDDCLAERWREWDSCFSKTFSYIHGGSIRTKIAARYRQWLCHKMATWTTQFGTPGCVGCGRCRTWCPAGIDFVVELQALANRATDPAE